MKKIIALVLAALMMIGGALAQEDPSASAKTALEAALAKEASASSDAWAKYLLSQPVESVAVSDGVASFSLPAWKVDLDALSGDASGWLLPIWISVTTGRTNGTAHIESGEDGAVSVTGLADFVKATRRAAQAAKTTFDRAQARQALVARLLPTAFFTESGEQTEAFSALCRSYAGLLSPAKLQAALSMQKNASMDVNDGPTALRIVFYHGNSAQMETAAYAAALDKLDDLDLANAYTRAQIEQIYADCFSAQGASFRSSNAEGAKAVLTVDLPAIMQNTLRLSSFESYVDTVLKSFDLQVDQLTAAARQLPDYPLREQPDTGVLTGGATIGTKLIFQAPDDGQARYVILKDAKTSAISATLFVRSGENCTVYAPEGGYDILLAKGVNWYGPARLFDTAGEYTKTTSPVQVQDITHYHTVTLDETSANAAAAKLDTSAATLADFAA